MSVVLITGSSTGIGNLTAKTLARAGHTVFASMRGIDARNAGVTAQFHELAEKEGLDLHVVELDVTSQASADAAVKAVVEQAGRLDVVVQNAGHLYVGYVEAFTDQDLTHLIDINAVGAHRVNRAALPYLRAQRSGTLLYVGSTIIVTTPPFLGPYVASKAAFDALAVVTSYEAAQFGIETSIVMPGAITQGTSHFPNASRASDAEVSAAYAFLDPLVARNEEATASLMQPDIDQDPQVVADEISRVLGLPRGHKPFRSVVDFTAAGVDHVMAFSDLTREAFVTRMGFGQTLQLQG
ncbi:SDR family NAD(P)-dependent oxidoreductase [Kineosporia sp. NBRC 101731]|uniref:SDR family NAD(P)-dependent oxidoreductase n=1 Tax=Kineosporia sp. NBRC 101731 TaxID=3032199 RepID=UPI0024A1995E|nr:SDR family NAD(P)-dependent oxidoreductase [Kineosporia sp. NBRC 101731]GLY30777.1 short-chain dehydrogenase/reductase [Kineosporia sp. NBRC 101731]